MSWLWIATINTGMLHTGDAHLRLQMAHAWWTGSQEVAPDYQPKSRIDFSSGVRGVGGKRYIFYDPGQSLLMLPGDMNNSFSEKCLSRLKTSGFALSQNKVFFFPFNYSRFRLNRKWIFLAWGLVLTLTIIVTTVYFIRPIFKI
jgi:hypothetical protein